MRIITKNIWLRALMETYETAKFDRSPNNLPWDIVLTDWWPEPKKKKKVWTKPSSYAQYVWLHLRF